MPFPDPSPPTALALAAEPDGGDHRPDTQAADTAEQVLYRQRVNGTVVHNGVRGPGSRWSLVEDTDEAVEPVEPPVIRRQQSPHEGRVIGAQARAAMGEQLAERHGEHHGQALALVAEHGPVSPAWVADQLVKNRRDTIALMRDMALAGELVETDDGGYYDIPDRDDQAQAA